MTHNKVLVVVTVVVVALLNVVVADVESEIIIHKVQLGSRLHELHVHLQNSFHLEEDTRRTSFAALAAVRESCDTLQGEADILHHNYAAQSMHATLDKLSNVVGFVGADSCTFCSNDTSNSTIWKNFPLSRNFVCNTDCDFVRQLLDDDRNYLVDDFLQVFSDLQLTTVNGTGKDIFFVSVLMSLLQQTKTNPMKYVSHGTDHAVRVMNWNGKLLNIKQVRDALTTQYGISNDRSLFLLMLNGIMHDVGYTPLNYILYTPSPPKWIHSVLGQYVSELALYEQTNDDVGYRILSEIVESTNTSSTIVDDFLYAIRTHNFDDQLCSWIVNNSDFQSMCSFDTNKMPIPPLVGDGIYTRKYTPGDASVAPMVFTIRIADNLDFINTRLTSTQRNPKLMLFLWYLFKDQTVRAALIAGQSTKQLLLDAKERYKQCVWGPDWKNNADFQDPSLSQVIDGTTTESFLHFYSNWMISATSFDADNFVLYVNLTQPDIEELKFIYNPGPALYQINRMASSMHSLAVNSTTSFLDLVTIVINEPVPGVDGNSFPLRAFTQKPVYTPTGPAGRDICGEYCGNLTKYLTNSPEACIVKDKGQFSQTDDDTTCDYSAFGELPTFSDLNYNPFLVPNSQPALGKLKCLYTPPHNDTTTKDNKILKIVLPVIGGVIVLGVVVTILVLIRRKKRQYIPIQ